MGPWSHGQWNSEAGDKLGQANFGFNTSEQFRAEILLPFFKQHLKGEEKTTLATATMFETGSNRWRSFDNWPPKNTSAKTLYFGRNEKLLDEKEREQSFNEYVSDPNKPVPHSANIGRGWDRPYMVEDQRFSARRPDVLVFETAALEHDQTISGAIELDLWVSTTESAADFVVKLVDVFPGKDVNKDKVDKENGNRHELVRWGVMRGRFRNSMTTPEPFTPNTPTQVKFELYDVLHTIKRGHKLQIQIQSSMFPFLDRNPQKYVDNIFNATAEDFVKATHKVYLGDKHSSAIRFKVLN